MSEKAEEKTWFDKAFRDKDGNVVLWQAPNFSLIIFALCAVIALFTSGWVFDLAVIFAACALGYWAHDEIIYGVNLFRRMLGWVAAVLVAIMAVVIFVRII